MAAVLLALTTESDDSDESDDDDDAPAATKDVVRLEAIGRGSCVACE